MSINFLNKEIELNLWTTIMIIGIMVMSICNFHQVLRPIDFTRQLATTVSSVTEEGPKDKIKDQHMNIACRKMGWQMSIYLIHGFNSGDKIKTYHSRFSQKFYQMRNDY